MGWREWIRGDWFVRKGEQTEMKKVKQPAAEQLSESANEADRLVEEIEAAHREWVEAYRHFEYAMGKDQVDYAVYAIEAAEKRYEMLLRKAKTLKVEWSNKREVEVG